LVTLSALHSLWTLPTGPLWTLIALWSRRAGDVANIIEHWWGAGIEDPEVAGVDGDEAITDNKAGSGLIEVAPSGH
jgi:hypothetical protein